MHALDRAKKNVALLSACQALLFTNNATVIAVNGLAGYALAENKAYATLPVTGWVVGAAATSFLASMLMKAIGRRAGFSLGALIGIVGASLAAYAVSIGSLALLTFATFVFGTYNAFGQFYRFAAADAAPPDFKAKAISYVLAGGLVGGLIGPKLSTFTIDAFSTKFVGAYLALIVFLVLAILVLQWLDIPRPSAAEQKEPGRPLAVIMRQPKFIVAVVTAAFGFGVMNLLMVATPLEMTAVCGHSYDAAALVISSHVIGMFGPSFFTGSLIKRYGVANMIVAGLVIQFITVAIALSGVSVAHFWASLVLLGVGWNFQFIAATTLLTEVHAPAERAKTQGANDSLVFIVMMMTSFGSGFILNHNGWAMLNYLSLVLTVTTLAVMIWGLRLRLAKPAQA